MFSHLLLPRPNTKITTLFSTTSDNPIQLHSPPSRPNTCFFQKSPIVHPLIPPPPSLFHLRDLIRKSSLQEAVAALENGSSIDATTYVSLLQSCVDSNSVALGRRLHALIGSVRGSKSLVETKLVGMYAKCGSLEDARTVFDGMRERNLFTWSVMIGGCTREGRWEEVVDLFHQMMFEGCHQPDGFLVHRVLQACANSRDAQTGRLVHSIVIRCGFLTSCSTGIHIANSVLSMYVKSRKLASARRFFETMNGRDLVTWNSMISGYCQYGEHEEALRLFEIMQLEGVKPGVVTWNVLITNFNHCGSPEKAMEAMKKMEEHHGLIPDVFTWTSVISGLFQNNQAMQALNLFREMRLGDIEPNGMTLAVVISSCASLKALEKGMEVHSLAVKMGHVGTLLVGNSLVDMYSKCGRSENAERIFCGMLVKDVFTWNSMIGGYAHSGFHGKAYDLFSKMEDLGVRRNVITWNTLISSCLQNGEMDQAMELFHKMESNGVGKSTASWNLLIAGTLRNGDQNNALRIFRQMQCLHVKPDKITILSILPACANLTSTRMVKEIHACILRIGLQIDELILNSFIDTYAKSGDIASSQSLFDDYQCRDISTWNSLITGYIMHKCPRIALDLFKRLKQVTKPNRATLFSTICAHGLLKMVSEGKELFYNMFENYQLTPDLEHYAALVDLLSRSDMLEEALELIMKMPIEPDTAVWSSLLSGCRFYGNEKIAKLATEHMMKLEPKNPIFLSLFLQLQALCKNSGISRSIMLNKYYNSNISIGCCWMIMEYSRMVLRFSSSERSKPNSKLIHAKVNNIAEAIDTSRYATYDVHLQIEEEESEASSGIHSEKLAIAYSLINFPNCTTLRIVKNIRMCYYCHTTAKFISLTHECQILLKDPSCLHKFRDGKCSCGDYW